MLRLLVVTAHPDDESAGFGGSLLLARERQAETFVVCLTPGQAATHRGRARSDEELSAIRREEFRAACEHLKVSEARLLNCRDGALDRENFYEVAGELVGIMRSLRPHVVLTFGPEGGVTAHTDHGMAAIFTTTAFQWAGREKRFPEQLKMGATAWQPQKLYYSTNDFFLEGRPPIAPAPITTEIEIGKHLQTKIEAFRKHTSQSPLFELFETHVRPRGTKELFHLAACSQIKKAEGIETDLWEGVQE